MAITKEQIFSAADELDEAGKNPTLAEVRKLVGGGSFTTISEAMNEWRARKASQPSVIREPAPAAVAEKMATLGAEVWAAAMELANTRLATEREALESARVDMESARSEAAELADQLTADLDDAKGQIAALEDARTHLVSELDQLRAMMVGVTERAATAEARADELRSEIAHARSEVDQLRKERDSAVDAVSARAVQAERLGADLAASNAKGEEAVRRVGVLESEVERVRKERDGALASSQTNAGLLKQFQAQLERTQALYEEGRKALEAAREAASLSSGKVLALEALLGSSPDGRRISKAKKP